MSSHDDLKNKITTELDKMTDGVISMKVEYTDYRKLSEVFGELTKKVSAADVNFNGQYTQFGIVTTGKKRQRHSFTAIETVVAIRVKLPNQYTQSLEDESWKGYGLSICTLQKEYVLIVGFANLAKKYPISSPEHLYDMLTKINDVVDEYTCDYVKVTKSKQLLISYYNATFKKAAEKYCGQITSRKVHDYSLEYVEFTFVCYNKVKTHTFRVEVTLEVEKIKKMVESGINEIESFSKNEMRRAEIVKLLDDYGNEFCAKFQECFFEILTRESCRTEILFTNKKNQECFGFKVPHAKTNSLIKQFLSQFESKAAKYAI